MSVAAVQKILQQRKSRLLGGWSSSSSNTASQQQQPTVSASDITVAVQKLTTLGGGFRLVQVGGGGGTSGAAPMIAGALLARSPKVAMAVERPSRKKKLTEGSDASAISTLSCLAEIHGSVMVCQWPVAPASNDRRRRQAD